MNGKKQAEARYTIYESELTTLENNSQILIYDFNLKEMRKLMCKKLKILCISILLICLSLFPHSVSAEEFTSSTYPTRSISMTVQQYNMLKAIIERQDNRLEMLQQKLTLLKNNSVSVSSELTESQNELSKLRAELTTTQESLESARISLVQAEEILKKQEESLQTLTKQIKSMEHKQTVLRRQRDVYATLFALSVGAVIARR